MDHKPYFTYILANGTNKVIYVGVTSDLAKRVYQHKHKLVEGFTKKYNVDKLVYYETHESPEVAIKREKQIKNLLRVKKEHLIQIANPKWSDLYDSLL